MPVVLPHTIFFLNLPYFNADALSPTVSMMLAICAPFIPHLVTPFSKSLTFVAVRRYAEPLFLSSKHECYFVCLKTTNHLPNKELQSHKS